MNTKPPSIERRVELFRLRGVIDRQEVENEITLDEQIDAQNLNFSKLSGYHEWVIEAEFKGGYSAALVTCNWSSGTCFIAKGEYNFWRDTEEYIASHGQIIPYVKRWLTRAELYGILRNKSVIECPHLEIYGRTT